MSTPGPAMPQMFAQLERATACDDPLLLIGAAGFTELLAAGVHDGSARHDGPFVVADCGRIRAGSLGRELIPAASGGTLFLAEVGDLPLPIQREAVVLLEHCLGDIRAIASTRHDLPLRVRAGRFAEELYYRLAAIKVVVPTRGRPRPPGRYSAARRAALERFEREYCAGILDDAGGIVAGAARRAGISRQMLHRLLRRYRLDGA